MLAGDAVASEKGRGGGHGVCCLKVMGQLILNTFSYLLHITLMTMTDLSCYDKESFI